MLAGVGHRRRAEPRCPPEKRLVRFTCSRDARRERGEIKTRPTARGESRKGAGHVDRRDQFGTRSRTLKVAKVLRAPVSPSGAFIDDVPASSARRGGMVGGGGASASPPSPLVC